MEAGGEGVQHRYGERRMGKDALEKGLDKRQCVRQVLKDALECLWEASELVRWPDGASVRGDGWRNFERYSKVCTILRIRSRGGGEWEHGVEWQLRIRWQSGL